MTGRERILCALDGGEPDRIPCALAFFPVDLDAVSPPGMDAHDFVDVQFVRSEPTPDESALAERVAKLPYLTRLGSVEQVSTYEHWRYRPEETASRNPLAEARTLDELASFPFPTPIGSYASATLRTEVERNHARGLCVGGNLPHLGGELFESAWRLRGLENFLLDLVERPEWAEFLLDRLCEIARDNARRVAAAGVDILSLDDDVGMPGTMFMSPATWRRFFRPRLASIISAAKSVNPSVRVLYHSDGTIDPILDDLVDLGIDALNPLQPEHMDALAVRRRYGTRPALWGTVGSQTLLSLGTPAQIREEVRRRAAELGPAGLVLCPAYDPDEPDIPAENVEAFLLATRELGAA
jgi:uroporphyrinogen decarboxylase